MKYIIEIPDDVQYVLLSGKADNKYYTAVRPIAELEELNSDYINENFGELQDEAYKRGYEDAERIWRAPSSENEFYQKGLEDAWKATKRIFGYEIDGGIPISKIREAFGIAENAIFCTADIIRDYTAQEAIDKIKAYEDERYDRIEVGDEVIAPYGKAIVTAIKNEFVYYLYPDGDRGVKEPKNIKKTGKHYDIASILEAMRK